MKENVNMRQDKPEIQRFKSKQQDRKLMGKK